MVTSLYVPDFIVCSKILSENSFNFHILKSFIQLHLNIFSDHKVRKKAALIINSYDAERAKAEQNGDGFLPKIYQAGKTAHDASIVLQHFHTHKNKQSLI